jgi:hypothetical protein
MRPASPEGACRRATPTRSVRLAAVQRERACIGGKPTMRRLDW